MRCIALKAPLFHPLCELGDGSPVALYVRSLCVAVWVGWVWAVGCPTYLELDRRGAPLQKDLRLVLSLALLLHAAALGLDRAQSLQVDGEDARVGVIGAQHGLGRAVRLEEQTLQ